MLDKCYVYQLGYHMMQPGMEQYYAAGDHHNFMPRGGPPGVPAHGGFTTFVPTFRPTDHTDYTTAATQSHILTITPNAIISAGSEPIEAGSLPQQRRRRSESGSVSRQPPMAAPPSNANQQSLQNQSNGSSSAQQQNARRSSVTWETMTDEEREEAQRLRRKEEAYKTALCDAYKRNTVCPYGEACRFAHGENELRLPAQPRGKAHPKYKTQLCDKFSAQGQCPYGPRCQFIHKLKKGLALLDYENLLSQGHISPAREDEITTGDAVHYRRGSGGYGNAVSPQKRYRRDSTSSSSGYPPRRLSFDPDMARSRPIVRQPEHREDGAIYPKMQIINIEKALYEADENGGNSHPHQRNVKGHSQQPFGNVQQNHQQERRRSRGDSQTFKKDYEPRNLHFAAPLPNRATSMQSLVFHGSSENLREMPVSDGRMPRKVTPKVPDLSLIKEVEEVDNDITQENTAAGRAKKQLNHWTEMVFGKRMDTITEDEPMVSSGIGADGTGATEAELLIQSCDEELLAQGLYDYKYPDASLDMLKMWKPQN